MVRTLPLIEFPAEPLDWNRLFPVPRPVQVEVGSGKGRFLIRAAEADGATNWVGLETRWGTLALAVRRIVARGLDNALCIRCDAMHVVRVLIPEGSVAAFHVYYPDPWWKKRHRKRRVFNATFVADLARGLAPGGQLRVSTDVEEYFEEIVALVGGSGLFETIDLPPEAWTPGGEPLTSFEAKYLRIGREPRRAAFRRGARPAPPREPWVSRKPPSRPLAGSLKLTGRGR